VSFVLQELTSSQAELLEKIQKLKQVCIDRVRKCRLGLVQLISRHNEQTSSENSKTWIWKFAGLLEFRKFAGLMIRC
jgi:hypothetical protein